MKWGKLFFIIGFISLISACTLTSGIAATESPSPTITPTETLLEITPTPLSSPTATQLSMPENVHDLTVYNYDTSEDETISPTFDEDMATWVWKNEKGEVRRFLDLETDHIFAQTESTRDRLIYQIDTEFGWEADLTELVELNKNDYPAGSLYLWMMWNTYPDVIKGHDENTKLIFKIVHGSYDDIVDKSKVSSTKDLGELNLEMSFFWPIYDEINNIQTLKTYLRNEFVKDKFNPLTIYTEYMLNYCPTSNPNLSMGALDVDKRLIQ